MSPECVLTGAVSIFCIVIGWGECWVTHGEYEAEATWSTRKFTPFVMQRISVAIQIAAASEIRQALGMSLALSAA